MGQSSSSRTLEVSIQQGCVPEYRVPFFERLSKYEPCVKVIAGQEYFSVSTKSSDVTADWFEKVQNHFFLGRRFLWQSDSIRRLLLSRLVVVELNPRIISLWPVLICRKMRGRDSLVWGHYHGGRSRAVLKMGWLRRLMWKLSVGVAAYTESDARRFLDDDGSKIAVALGNACLSEGEVVMGGKYNGGGRVVYVGRLVVEKEVSLLVSSFLSVMEKGGEYEGLDIVGSGPEEEALKQIVNESAFADRVVFHGHLSAGKELAEIYEGALFATSPGYAGLSVIQAMAHGVPVIVSRYRQHSPEIEACEENATAVFVDEGTVEGWTQELLRLSQDSGPWIEKREKIAAFVLERYTFESMVANFLDLVSLVEKKRK